MGYVCSYRWVLQHGVIAEVVAGLAAAVAPAAELVAVVVAELAAVVALAARVPVALLPAAARPYDARFRASMFLLSVSFNRLLTQNPNSPYLQSHA